MWGSDSKWLEGLHFLTQHFPHTCRPCLCPVPFLTPSPILDCLPSLLWTLLYFQSLLYLHQCCLSHSLRAPGILQHPAFDLLHLPISGYMIYQVNANQQ